MLKGRFGGGAAEMLDHHGGMPKGWKRMRDFADFSDTDPVESALWNERPTPSMPRRAHRLGCPFSRLSLSFSLSLSLSLISFSLSHPMR